MAKTTFIFNFTHFSRLLIVLSMNFRSVGEKFKSSSTLPSATSSTGITGKGFSGLNELDVLVFEKILHNYPIAFCRLTIKTSFFR